MKRKTLSCTLGMILTTISCSEITPPDKEDIIQEFIFSANTTFTVKYDRVPINGFDSNKITQNIRITDIVGKFFIPSWHGQPEFKIRILKYDTVWNTLYESSKFNANVQDKIFISNLNLQFNKHDSIQMQLKTENEPLKISISGNFKHSPP